MDLTTRRLYLTPFKARDIAIFHRLNTSAHVRQYLWDDEIISRKTVEDILQQNELHFRQDQFGLWKILLNSTSELVGYAGLWYFFEELQPQLLYAIEEQFTGRGYATEAGQVLINYAFEELNFDYLIAAMDKYHLASQQVALRLGMKFVETRNEQGKPTRFYRIERE